MIINHKHNLVIHRSLGLVYLEFSTGRMSFCGYFLTALIILKQRFSAAEHSVPPAPTLTQTAVRGSSVELICQAPQGYGGLVFKLYKIRDLIDVIEYSSEQQSSHFVLRGKDTKKENHYCCQYGNSMYSSYMQPVFTVSPLPSPHLMVEPSSGHVTSGETLSFNCQAPPDHQKHRPEAFLLLRSAKGTSGSMVAPAKLVSQSQEAHFSVKTMGQEDSGEYSCLYQLKLPKTGQVNSTASQPVHITVIELPVPTLSQHEGEVLECVGSPSYLQGLFSLFRVGVLSPVATHQASLTQHSARFPIPTHYEHGAQYQCQYSMSLGNYRAYSKMSMPVTLPCIPGYHSCKQTSTAQTWLLLLALCLRVFCSSWRCYSWDLSCTDISKTRQKEGDKENKKNSGYMFTPEIILLTSLCSVLTLDLWAMEGRLEEDPQIQRLSMTVP
ncbi:immunoglobulin superfamily member 1-like isoform X2 [Pseudorasbora parva]|uniref:immunoglobulin superfamily member 1-like isoform X2 n=1 Tax=Pseudorasbora parva TaxID=51549 RepID=UPI00351E3482